MQVECWLNDSLKGYHHQTMITLSYTAQKHQWDFYTQVSGESLEPSDSKVRFPHLSLISNTAFSEQYGLAWNLHLTFTLRETRLAKLILPAIPCICNVKLAHQKYHNQGSASTWDIVNASLLFNLSVLQTAVRMRHKQQYSIVTGTSGTI